MVCAYCWSICTRTRSCTMRRPGLGPSAPRSKSTPWAKAGAAEAVGHRLQRELGWIDRGHLVPRQRRRDPRVGRRSHRVGGSHGAVLGVLVVVEEDAVPLFFPPLRGGELRGAPLDLARER